MAKRLLLDILINVLGEYIELSEENFDLNLAVWSGQIILHDLQLKTDKLLRNYNLSILHGSIKTLEIIIPWTALLNSPVKIHIDGVYLQVGPIDVAFLDKQETRKRVMELKQQKLRLADKVLDFRGDDFIGIDIGGKDDNGNGDGKTGDKKESENSASYIQALTTKIVDNLEINLRNIHARLEDSQTIPGITYSAGITLSSFTLSTCDKNWVESYVARTANAIIRKLAKIENLGFYWNTNSISLAGLDFNAWVKAMHDLISRTSEDVAIPEQTRREQFFSNGGKFKRRKLSSAQYILSPTNKLAIKLVHNEKSQDPSAPKYDFDVESTNLQLSLDGLQYRQLHTTLEMIGAVERKRQPYSYKPQVRPTTGEAARAWWKYGCKLAIKRPRYIHLVILSKTANPTSLYEDSLTDSEREEMYELEERLPLNTLIIFRHMAAREMDEALKKSAAAAAGQSSSKRKSVKKQERTWVGWLSGEAAAASSSVEQQSEDGEADGGEISISSILQVLEESNTKSFDTVHATFMCLKLTSSASLEVSMYDVPIASAYMSLSALAKITTAGATAAIDLNNILAMDRCTPTPAIANIITVKQSLSSSLLPRALEQSARNQDFSVVFDSENGKSTLRISSLPLQFALNKICVQHLIGIFYWSNPNAAALKAKDSATEAAAAATAAAERMRKSEEDKTRAFSPQKDDGARKKVPIRDDAFEFIFEADAPKIIVPEDSSSDRGYLLLDSGYLKVRGFIGQDGMQWAISLNDVNAGVPLTVSDMYTFGDAYPYLIKPFDIGLMIQNIDKSTSDISVDVDIKPELRGELDKSKLFRLLVAIRQISDMLFLQPEILRESVIPPSTLYQPLVQKLILQHPDLVMMNGDSSQQRECACAAANSFRSRSNTNNTQTDESYDENDLSMEDAEESFPEIIKAIEVTTVQPDLRDPLRVKVDLVIRMPVVALDLTYDVEAGNHLVLEVRTLVTRLKTRAYDMQIGFDLSELSIEDSNRCLTQRDLARTPKGHNLIRIDYTYNYSRESPCYKEHATDIVVNFSNLGLNLDVITIMHLRPFMEVLLARRAPQPVPLPPVVPEAQRRPSNLPPINTAIAAPPLSGMHMVFTLEKVSLDILRPSESGMKEEVLDSAYSLQIQGLRADLDMRDLTKALVRLRSIEIIDIRSVSRDYAIKRVFCPVFEIEDDPVASESKDSRRPSVDDENDLLHLTYHQDSKQMSYLKLMLLNMSCFLSTETLLDLTAVASANFWAILELVSAPQPVVVPSPPDTCGFESPNPSSQQNSAVSVDVSTHREAPWMLVSPTPSLQFRTPPSSPYRSASSQEEKDEDRRSNDNDEKEEEEEEDDLSPSPIHPADETSVEDMNNTTIQMSAAQFTHSTMIISINAVNPRLVLLDDPTTEESQAIVGRCGIEIHWTRDLKIGPDTRQLRESLHMSMKNLEVFVLRNMTNWNPQPVLEPLGVEYNMRRESMNGKVVQSNVTIGTDNANARVSISDLALLQSILLRRPEQGTVVAKNRSQTISASSHTLSENESTVAVVSQQSPVPTPGATPNTDRSEKSPSYTFSFHLGTISLVAVNDFNGQNIPVARMLFEETKFCIVRGDDRIHGDGDFFASADFYNSALSVWEPILDRWHPEMTINTAEDGTVYDIKSDHTMQITISGIMLETLMQTYSLLTNFDDTTERELVPDIVLENCLGESLDTNISDSATGTHLLSLSAGQCAAIPRVKDASNKAYASATHMPSAVNIEFLGTFGSERLPLYNLPFNINKPRAYHLQTRDTDDADTPREKRMVVIEPIVEEVYENSRYDPMAGRWRQPFLLGDPFEWTDASGSVRKDITSIKLTSERWEWQDVWNVDMHGMVGEEFDQDGWEYSTAFGSFSIASYRRNKMPMDCVRRRRWTRTRLPTAASIDERRRPLSLFWEVQPLKNGAKRVLIRSGMQIHNTMPFPIVIALSNSAWKEDREFGPINEGETFCVPLFCSYATGTKVKPADVPYDWSHRTNCSIQAYDFRSARDLLCGGPGLSSVCVRVLSTQVHKSLLISFAPYIIIRNKLPCDMLYRCTSSDRKREEGELLSGARSKLAYMNLASWPTLSITLGPNFPWSVPITLDANSSKPRIIDLSTLQGSTNGLVISMTCAIGSGHSMEIDIYSKSLLIDRTGLGISVWSQKRLGEIMMRHTYARPQLKRGEREIERKYVSSQVKRRLKVLAKVAAKSANSQKKKSSSLSQLEGTDMHDDGRSESAASRGSFTSKSSSLHAGLRNSSSTNLFEFGDDTEVEHKEKLGYDVLDIGGADGSSGGENETLAWDSSLDVGLVSNFAFDSKNEYVVTKASIGDLVYTDSSFTWSFIPNQLRGHTYIRTANDDKWRRSKSIMKFSVSKPALVLLLVDMRVKNFFKWLKDDGYRRVVDQAIARRVENGSLQEIHFAIYGKYVEECEIVLRGNWCKEVTTMYSVFVVPAESFSKEDQVSALGGETWQPSGGNRHSVQHQSSMLEQVTFEERYERLNTSKAWIEGEGGMCMFYAGDDVIAIGVNGGTAWSDDIRISMTSSSFKGSFEVVDWDTLRAYQLSYQMRYMPGLFTNTQQITVTPRYCIVNLMDEELLVVQRGSREIMTYRPYIAEGWHKSDISLGTSVQLRCQSSLWSLGTIDINEIGNSVLHLPRKYSENVEDQGALVLHVEVKVADPGEYCSVVVIVWRASVESTSDISIRNETNAHVTVMQADLDLEPSLRESRLFEVCVAPGAWMPFGWADPDKECNVLVTVGTTLIGPRKRIAKVSMLKAGELLRLPDNSGRSGPSGEVVLSVLAENGGRILRISHHSNDTYALYGTNASMFKRSGEPNGYSVNFFLSSLGVSLVVEKPIRREFLSLYIDGMEGRLKIHDNVKSYEFMVMDLQVDNYSETVIHSVLLYCVKEIKEKKKNPHGENREDQSHSEGRQEGKDAEESKSTDDSESIEDGDEESVDESETPVIQLSVVQEMPVGTSTPIFRYVAFRVLALSLEVDSATLQLLFTDLLNDLKYVSREQALALSCPTQWMDENNKLLASPEHHLQIVDVYRAKMSALTSKMYFEKLIIHPMKVTFTFVQAPFPRKGTSNATLQSTAFNIFTSLAAVDRMQLKLKSFEVEDALESYGSLQNHVVNKTLQDLQSQLAQIAGSLAVLGSPMGFARKVGGGVKDFFYEPYLGAVHSPHDFVVGLGKGTSSFFTNFVAGAMNSTVAFAGTASKGIGYLSGDGEYVRKRAIKRQRNRANRGGIMDGIMDGGESVMSGFTSGMSGLVTRPFEEARKTGASGFLKGLGLGLLGAFIKPVMGLTDGAASVASGISNQVGKERLCVNVRPARALERSEADSTDLVLAPLNLKAAYAQEFVIKRSKKMSYEDAYLNYIIILEETGDEAIILSEMYLYWRRSKSLWGRTWANISHCVFQGDSIGIVLYARATNEFGVAMPETASITCYTRERALGVYACLALNSHRMGNPSSVIPYVEVAHESWLTDSNFRNSIFARRGNAANLENELDGYRFGSANFERQAKFSGAQEDVLTRMEAKLERGYKNWQDLDEKIWTLLWEWDCTHKGLNASRSCATLIINRSESPIQIARVQMVHGRNVVIMGSAATKYETESRAIMPNGSALVFIWAFLPSPIEIGHLKANINTAAFSATVASTQRESSCEGKGGFACGFIEKTVNEWWSKYVICVS